MRKIVVAGSVLVDRICGIDAYPGEGELTQIRSLRRVPGGLVPNTGRDLRLLDPYIPVLACGAVGDDDDGRFVTDELVAAGIDVSGVVTSRRERTSFTDVMSVTGGERTFFTYPGASAAWGVTDFPFDAVQAEDIVLLGYFLLLARIDAGDGRAVLGELKRRGAKTAIDLVTENSDRYRLVRDCLPEVDYLIVNETEASRLAGTDPADLAGTAEALFGFGVRERVVIHTPEKGFTRTRTGTACERPSVRLPAGFIKGKTGAGDAYCAGALTGIFRGCDDAEILRRGAVAAVGALSAPGATEGMRSFRELEELCSSISTPC